MMFYKKYSFFILTALTVSFLLLSPVANVLADVEGQNQVFNTNETFDKFGRKSISATLRYIGSNTYFYVEDKYWDNLNFLDKEEFIDNIKKLSNEFDSNIYPKETSFWGQESRPGLDGDNHITILLEQLKSGNGGYFATLNNYLKSEAPQSNEREMMAINVESIFGNYTKIFLAHEFQHLISFNQKELLRNSTEDVWFNELRSEYSIDLVGYNDVFTNSNLERRAQTFFDNSSDSLTEWPNVSLDYALVTIFGEYIVQNYRQDFLKDTLQTGLSGIASINDALGRRGLSERFIDVFGNWLAASYINDDSINSKFGYSKLDLKNFKASPQRLTILSGPDSSFFNYLLKPWQVYGHKFLVGNSLSSDKVIKIYPKFNSKFVYADNLGRFSMVEKDFYVNNPGGLQYFFIFPVNDKKISDFGAKEEESLLALNIIFENKILGMDFGSTLKDGVLIKRAREKETYVIEGKYKRYLRPEIIALYGHLDPAKVIEVDDKTFYSYTTSNYVRYINEEQVYAVWPDGSKHWLNITSQQWDASGRDWGAIFIINDLELNAYQTGANITR